MHVRADRVLGKADLRAAMLGTEDAADRLVAFDPLALYAEQLRKPASLPVTNSGRSVCRAARSRAQSPAEACRARRCLPQARQSRPRRAEFSPHVLGDFFSLDSCTNTISLLSAAIFLPSLVILLLVRGSAQNPRMNPCPSARPGEGEREENRRGDRPIWRRVRERRLGRPILFLLGYQDRFLAPPTAQTMCGTAAPQSREG